MARRRAQRYAALSLFSDDVVDAGSPAQRRMTGRLPRPLKIPEMTPSVVTEDAGQGGWTLVVHHRRRAPLSRVSSPIRVSRSS